jgi:sugar O-acyltransferase (sialic acid O-acetyltransferase NeuD family)
MVKNLIILGTGGSSYDVLDIVDRINAVSPRWRIFGFLDDSKEKGSVHLGYRVLGKLADAKNVRECFFIDCIGSDRSFRRRPAIIESAGLRTEQFATLIHPRATVSSRAKVGKGVYVNPGCVIAGDVKIGNHVLISPGVIIGHNTTIADYNVIAPGAIVSGFVHVERNCYIGCGSSIKQSTTIGQGALIGMGAVVLRDVEAETTVVGNPARVLVRNRQVLVNS